MTTEFLPGMKCRIIVPDNDESLEGALLKSEQIVTVIKDDGTLTYTHWIESGLIPVLERRPTHSLQYWWVRPEALKILGQELKAPNVGTIRIINGEFIKENTYEKRNT